ncbi:ArdC-like ssDNA-binding domain-containing protein [Bacillus cereus]|uniref:N-terminal domain-containing protein n=2 Tax=Bacillus cereus group TaxID=86661 RepID=A0A9W5VD12_BACCE|nr:MULTISPECIES: ArdC-like ssDNA-binding domain-containing protein [Bacillus]AIE37077.1 hypothetical protein BTK_33761 [Bacillus thuringiensis serovar kurstaki str. HD-1]AJK38524.1 hypothetical protein BG08_6837 [Bacillus thuringiensis serovar kurstaki]AKJ62928.1 hypothetical protein XI92_32810 [Bacillus thuringiensis]ALL62395.1 hypothetical protein AQ980_31665 [Bacillus thuringiensis]AUO31972.1 hypothetical protein [Bacillus thuringiensis serovar israelensis]
MMFYDDMGISTEETRQFMGMVLEDLEHYYHSKEGVLELAEFMSRFSNYSGRNMQVIKSQFPDAYACANLKTYNKAGFSLKNGEQEMKVFHPLIKEYVRDPKTKKEVLVKDLTVDQKGQVKKGDLKIKKDITYYLKKSALDISQTNATSDDLKKIFPNRQFDFEVSEENKNMLISGIHVVAEKEKIESKALDENENTLEIKQIPEVIYELIREKLQGEKGKGSKDEVAGDFETRMATHIVCTHYGMDTSENTVPYISKWVESDQDLKEKDSSIINIHDTARTFINVIDQEISELQRGTEKELQKHNPVISNDTKELNEKDAVNDEKEQKKFEFPAFQQRVLKRIQEKAEQNVAENIGLNLGSHWNAVSQRAELNSKNRWNDYKINLSEDGKYIEDIQPNMILSLGELNTIVNKFGTEKEVENLKIVTEEMKPHYEADSKETELFNTHVAKVSVDQDKNMKVECISEYVSDSDIEFDFNHSVAEAIDSINSSITKAHKEVMSEEIERQGSNQELSTGQQDEEAAVMKKQEARKIARMAYMQQMER